MVSAPRCRPGARGLLALLLLLLPLPGARGQCGAPPRLSRAIPYDTNRTEGFPIGTEVTYKCSGGFVKIPGKSDTVVCLSNSEWSTIGELCGPACGAPPRLKSAALSQEDGQKNYLPSGTTVSYVCRPGYESTELKPVITCLENLRWSEAPEFCRGKSCGVPKGPEHGRAVVITNDLYGAKANIICDEGFRLHGRAFIQCLLKGDQVEWSQLPTCQGLPCKQLELENGRVHLTDHRVGATANFSCNEGYRLIGTTSAQCVVAGNGVNWDKELPYCQGQCGALPRLSRAVPHDTSHTEGFPIGTAVTYRCLDGFVKIPGKSDTVVCLSNSEWSTFGEFCSGSCGAPPRLKSATLSKEDGQKNYCPPGSTVSYVCRPGYESTEVKPVITCLENLTWSEAPEFCRGKSCGVPKGPEHGRAVVLTNDLYGARANIICDEGFRIHGRPFIQCLLKGDQVEWSQLPTCQAIPCPPPPDITHGSHTGQSEQEFSFGSAVTYKCDQGFSLIGKASIHCTTKDNVNGEWSGPAPECKGQCGALPRLSRAIPYDTSPTEGFPIGTEVTYRCLDGFVKIPGKSDTVVCLSNSEWSTFGEFCNASCGAPPRIRSAVLSEEDEKTNYHPNGTTVSYVCRPGYESTELKPVITCLENLTWSEAHEFCRGKSCGVPKGPEHGRAVVLTNDLYGARANIICDHGFRLHGLTFIQCLLKGDQVEWSQLPTCHVTITQDKPTTVPPEGTEVAGTSSELGFYTRIGIPSLCITFAIVVVIVVFISIRIYQKEIRSYNVNPDSPKYQITTT